MRKFLLLSIVLTAFASCGHMYGHRKDCSCKSEKSCASSEGQKQGCSDCKGAGQDAGKTSDKKECDDCKKAGKS